jgi:hypothetical protein
VKHSLRRVSAALIAIALPACAGCGSTISSGKAASSGAAIVTAPLTTSLSTAQGTWAIAVMGGLAANENNFWQVFVRPAGASGWSLATPPGVADNGGLVAAGDPASLLIGFRPSQGLLFSPLAASSDKGRNWTPGLLDASLANVPDALGATPAGQELALLPNGTIDTSTTAGSSWSQLTTLKALAATAAGHDCGILGINAVTFGLNKTMLAAGSCQRPGVAGVFSDTNGTWQAAGPPLPTAYAGDRVQVLRLSSTAEGNVALLLAGGDLLATWTTTEGTGTSWSTPVALAGVTGVRASGFGPDGSAWALLSDGRAEVISGAGGSWQALPALPADTSVLAPGTTAATGTAGTAGTTGYEALAAVGTKLTVWRLAAGAWTKVQVVDVPIVYGSSS